MKKKILIVMLTTLSMVMLTGCCIGHEWMEASCTKPKTCTKCGTIEGEMLEHVWEEATCSKPKTCGVCGVTEGEKLEHILAEANYQQASLCQVCGEEVGEPLQAAYEEWGIDVHTAEINKVYDFEVACNDDTEQVTIAKVSFTNYQIFKSDDEHPAKDGYEWRTVDVNYVFGDENSYKYGFSFDVWWDDYYIWIDNDEENRLTINYNGVEYSDCELYTKVISGEWKMEEKYGWERTYTLIDKVSILVPEGYDGFVYGPYDTTSNFWDVDLKDVAPEDYMYFRFK